MTNKGRDIITKWLLRIALILPVAFLFIANVLYIAHAFDGQFLPDFPATFVGELDKDVLPLGLFALWIVVFCT